MPIVGSRESNGWEMKVLGPNEFERFRECFRGSGSYLRHLLSTS
jgi:hypothetical protein